MPADIHQPDESSVGSRIGDARHHSVILGTAATLWNRLTTATQDRTHPFTTAYERSVCHRWGETVSKWLVHSFVFCWLTKEPETRQIVVDLEQTWTVGPILHLADRITSSRPVQEIATYVSVLGRRTASRLRHPLYQWASAGLVGVAVFLLALSAGDATVGSRAAWLAVLLIAGATFVASLSRSTLEDSSVYGVLYILLVPPTPPTETDDDSSP